MTLLPSSDFGIRGHEGKAYDVNPVCAVPGCNVRSAHAHHLWPRSYLRGQPYEYVMLPDGTIIGNRIGLCVEHHDNVTGEIGGYKAHIIFAGGLFYWTTKDFGMSSTENTAFMTVGPLDPQPPGIAPWPQEDHAPVGDGDICGECGRPRVVHSKPKKPRAPRHVKDWTLTVPDDAEIGAELLDEMADEFATLLGFDDASARLRRYHAVATVLAWGILNRRQFVADIVEASKA